MAKFDRTHIITIPSGVKVDITAENTVNVSGPHGSLSCAVDDSVIINLKDNGISLSTNSNSKDEKRDKAYHGLYSVLISNMISGVVKPFTKKLELIGVGYKANMVNSRAIELGLGFSHPIFFVLPKQISCEITSNKGENIFLTLSGADKYLVGQIAASIRDLRPVEPYKGKGIRYFGEVVKLKEKKTTK